MSEGYFQYQSSPLQSLVKAKASRRHTGILIEHKLIREEEIITIDVVLARGWASGTAVFIEKLMTVAHTKINTKG